MNAYAVSLRRNNRATGYERGPKARDRIVVASSPEVAARKAMRDTKKTSAYTGWSIFAISQMPELIQ